MKQSRPAGSSRPKAADPSPDVSYSAAPATPEPFACADSSCRTFSTAKDALAAALPENVLIVGFGEAHAPSTFVGETTVVRFERELLPELASRSERLLVELLVPPQGCEADRKQVQAESNAITEGQAKQNQNEYVELGKRARKLGMTPDILRPDCDDMKAIAEAEVGVLAMMETIATLSVEVVKRWLSETKPERPLLVLYGGALHNDAVPRDSLETWSYGPRLADLSRSRYVEVDLVVPELVQDTDSWRKFAWYAAVRSLPPDHGPTLVQAGKSSFALVFPKAAE